MIRSMPGISPSTTGLPVVVCAAIIVATATAVFGAVPNDACTIAPPDGVAPSLVEPIVEFGVEEVDYEDIGDDIPGWFADAASRGISIAGFELMSPSDGFIAFDSPTLRAAGFRVDPEYGVLLPTILREARTRGVRVLVMMESLAHILTGAVPFSSNIDPRRLTPDAVSRVIGELADAAQSQGVAIGITEEAYDETYLDALSHATKDRGVTHVHFFEDLACRPDVLLSEDYSYYPYDGRHSTVDQDYIRFLNDVGAYYGELGSLNVMYGTARACGIAVGTLTAGGWGMGSQTHQNVALFRSVQYGPTSFYFVVAEGDNGPFTPDEAPHVTNYDFNRSLRPLIESFGRKQSDCVKPVANLIIDEPPPGTDLADVFTIAKLSSLGAVTNAMLSAGFEVVVTTSKPYEGAQLFYVFGPGLIDDDGGDLADGLAELPSSEVPVFYQVAGALPDAPNWNRVKAMLGLSDVEPLVNEDDLSVFDPIPEMVTFDFPSGPRDVKYGGVSLEVWYPKQAGAFSLGHYLNHIEPTSVGGEVLVTGRTSRDGDGVFDDESALIIRNDNVFFVNGGYLHLDASSILANLMAARPVFNSPSYGYFTNGESRAAFYAPYDVNIDVNLQGGTRIAEFDETGAQVLTSLTLDEGRLTGTLARFHLAVVHEPNDQP